MEYYTTTSEHSTNTSTACDTPSIKVDITDTRYHSVQTSGVPSCLGQHVIHQALKQIQQNNGQLDITSRTHIYTHNKLTTKYSNIHDIGRKLSLLSTTQIRTTKITNYILAPLQLMSTSYKTSIFHPINLATMYNDNIIIRLQCYYNPPINHILK